MLRVVRNRRRMLRRLCPKKQQLMWLTSQSRSQPVTNLILHLMIIDFFKDAGKVVEVNFVGYAHVTFATPDAAQKALKLNGKDLVGRPVELDLPKGRGAKTQQKKDVKKQKEPKPTRKSIEESDSHDSSSSSESEEEKGPKRTRQYIEGAADDDIADTSTEESDSSHDTTSSEALLLAYYAKQIDSSEEEMADAEPTKSIKKGNIFLPLIVNRCMLYICMRFCCKDGLNFFEF
ncbi:uncharacterized protein [Rutidosis leptorrhynchoides]|uniref:uncharacterized protein isoform X3 n=1 Tax=Rutidosis leptorrhynchoides TaxID=125765 RepID=UPI003A9A5FB4